MVRPLLATPGCTIATGIRLRTFAEVTTTSAPVDRPGSPMRVRRPAVGRRDRERCISDKNKQNAVKAMVLTDASGRLLLCSPAQLASCADITHARQFGLVKHLIGGPAVEILADVGYQGLGSQADGRVVTPPHRKFKKNPLDWYEELYERQRKAYSSCRLRVEHGIAHLENWRALARDHGRRDHISCTIQAIAGLLTHQESATRRQVQPQ
ncbi:transposase family protein [Streptomyces lavendulae]|uniref:transposase family protein n=1 Tax=Streptomyces lavendulae TaxID=1914 RepID=UPI0033DF493A